MNVILAAIEANPMSKSLQMIHRCTERSHRHPGTNSKARRYVITASYTVNISFIQLIADIVTVQWYVREGTTIRNSRGERGKHDRGGVARQKVGTAREVRPQGLSEGSKPDLCLD
jgi:hypothetical protein